MTQTGYLSLVICVLVAVSFYTLYERKVLGLAHTRVGPSLVGWGGLLQPFADAVKLFSKEITLPLKGNHLAYWACPALSVLVSLLGLAVLPSARGGFGFTFLFILLLALTAVGGYLHLGVGWASNSGYGMIGALRCLAQSVSYEVSLALLFLCVALSPGFMDLARMGAGAGAPAGTLAPPLLVLWWVSCLAETNRSPFDFAEGESELVSGFNVEYGSGPFALLFIAEYTSMVLMALLTVLLFWGGLSGGPWLALMALFLFVWVRATQPRTRYDKLMGLSWLVILPVSLSGLAVLGCMSC